MSPIIFTTYLYSITKFSQIEVGAGPAGGVRAWMAAARAAPAATDGAYRDRYLLIIAD